MTEKPRDLKSVREDIAKLRPEQAELNERKQDIEVYLSRFDRRLSSGQAKIRARNLPVDQSITLWLKTKEQLLDERDKAIDEKREIEHRLSRLKVRLQELSDEEYFLKMNNSDDILPENVILCPHCLNDGKKVMLTQNNYQLICPSGHTFSLIENIE